MNGIQWSKRAFKQLRKLPGKDAKAIFDAAGTLIHFPVCRNVKKLTDHPYDYRMRVGAYRVMFNFDGEIRIISIEEVKRRNENTY